jgi:hypothetical protein
MKVRARHLMGRSKTIGKQHQTVLSGGCRCGAIRVAKKENFQHPDHGTPDDWTAKGTTGG